MRITLTKDEILNGNLFKGLIKITIPLIFLNLINTLYGVVDTYFVGRIGELQVGAISVISPITACGTAFTEGLCAAGISLISRSIGKGNEDKARKIAAHLLMLCVLLGIIACGVILTFGKDILLWLEVPSNIIDDSNAYLFGIAFDFVFLFIVSMYQAIRQAHGDSKSGVILNTVAAILNCILDPIFIFTFNMGTLGAAIATVLSKAIVTPIALYKLFKGPDSIGIEDSRLDFSLLQEIIKVAIPSSIGFFLSSFGFILMQKEIAVYGAIALSAYGVGSKISSIYYIFVNCWGTGLATFVGTSLGAGDENRARSAFKSSIIIVGIVSAIFIPLGFLTSRGFVNLFIKDISDELMAMALEYAYYSIFTAFCMGWMNSLVGVFNGSGNTLISMILNGSRIWFIRIPIIKLLNAVTSFGVANIWIAMCLSNLIVCLIGTYFYTHYKWQSTKLKI